MALLVADDADVRALSACSAVDAMREALRSAHEGRLHTPPRVSIALDELRYVFTAGGYEGGASGFRAYRAGEAPGDQLVAVWDGDGRLRGIVVGEELGARRTGALGAVAADVLASPDAGVVGVIGSGRQAWAQLWALRAVRRLRSVRVYSRDRARRAAFTEAVSRELDLNARAVANAHEAIREADLVVLATRSSRPVITATDVAPGAHVTTVGPKTVDAHETPLELVEAAAVITCDSPTQATAYASPFFTGDRQLIDLGAVVSGDAVGRRTRMEITLHCSVGLAGTEVALADRLFAERAR